MSSHGMEQTDIFTDGAARRKAASPVAREEGLSCSELSDP